jgi:hypothetical protein
LQADPHDAVQCYRCHSLETKEQAFDKEKVKYDVDALCMECHDTFCMHPVGISTDRSKPESAEMDLPLVERAGDFLISCLTCHNFHGMQTSRYLLRYTGNSQSERFKGLCSSDIPEIHSQRDLAVFATVVIWRILSPPCHLIA